MVEKPQPRRRPDPAGDPPAEPQKPMTRRDIILAQLSVAAVVAGTAWSAWRISTWVQRHMTLKRNGRP